MKAVITTATLDYQVGLTTCEQAVQTAGVECKFVIAHDRLGEGGVATANRAWAEALSHDPEYLCYVNDDVSFPQASWLQQMIEALKLKPDYGIVGASGNCGTNPQRTGKPGSPFGVIEVGLLSFFCVCIKREVIDKLGLLGADYIHWGCDADYCLRAQEAGWKTVWARHVYVQHDYVSLNIRPPKLQAWRRHDEDLFRERWGERAVMSY